MKRLALILAILPLLLAQPVRSQGLQALFGHAAFYNQAHGSYVETYLKIFGPSARYALTGRGTYQASFEVTLLLKNGDKIADFRKYNLTGMELADTLQGMPDIIDQQRISLPAGNYRLELSVEDNHSNAKPVVLTTDATVAFDREELKFSDFEFIEGYKPATKDNILTKSGFDLVPYFGSYYPPSVMEMSFYTELYNLDKKIGANQDFIFRYFVESAKDQVRLEDFNKFARQKSAAVNPLLMTVPITDLPGGSFNLVVEAVDRNNQVLATGRTPFQRSNPGLRLDVTDFKAIDVTSTFAEQIASQDSLIFYIQSLNPIGTMRENRYADGLVKRSDILQMQKFLYGFWKERNDLYPEAEWNHYKSQVLAIEELYKTKIKHGYETDMGYTWLRYGTPDQVEDSKHEPNAVPYIIWHYFHIENQSNVRFVFSNPNLVGTEYSLLYSDARDNRFNSSMSRGLYDRTSGFGTQGGYGSRFSSNFKK